MVKNIFDNMIFMLELFLEFNIFYNGLLNDIFLVFGFLRMVLYIGGIVMFVVLLWGLFVNIFILFVVFIRRDLNNIINIFIISFCINDIINFGFNNNFVMFLYFMGEFFIGMLGCEFVMFFIVLFMGLLFWYIGLIVIYCLIVVVFNNFYKKILKRVYICFVLVFVRVIFLFFLV